MSNGEYKLHLPDDMNLFEPKDFDLFGASCSEGWEDDYIDEIEEYERTKSEDLALWGSVR